MKRTFTLFSLFIFIIIFSNSSVLKDQNGRAGATGAPGEFTCAGGGCHGGGSSAASSVTLSSSPSFSLDQYFPDSVYTVTITVAASSYTRFGVGCELLNSNSTNSGTMSTPGSGAKMINTSRKNFTHSTPKAGANNQTTFTFKWNAPAVGSGDAIFYICGNAVNFNGNTNGDLPIPFSYTLTEGVAPTPTTDVGINEIKNNAVRNFNVYPNPSGAISNVSYHLKQSQIVDIDLYDLSGRMVKNLFHENELAGEQSHFINLQNVPKGVYFVRISANNQKVSQKLLMVN